MKTDILVKEAMKANPLTCNPSDTVKEIAKKMRSRRVGSSIVVVEKKPIGILTESDILGKIVAEGRDPGKVLIKDVMTTPLVSAGPYLNLEDAMRIMNKHNIRRLPVIEKGKLVGILTEKDIFRISPALMDLYKEWSLIEGGESTPPKGAILSGKCEECGKFSTNLVEVNGRFLCEECRESYSES